MILKEIQNRRSVREYKPDAVPQEYIAEIIKAGQFAPTARHNAAVEFIVIENQETKDKIFEIVGGKEFVKEAKVLIVPVTDTAKTNCPVEDLSAASENMFLQATSLGLGTVWKALKSEVGEREEIKKLLGIPEQYIAINIIPIGYPKEKPEPHTDKDFDEQKIHKEHW